jgi:formate-dependent nitrite reductase membrane component NrfD
VLVKDLERPERFLYILMRPNWTSWMSRGAFSRLFWIGALGLGGLAPIILVGLFALAGSSALLVAATAVVALAGGLAWEYIWVEAGQCVPNS